MFSKNFLKGSESFLNGSKSLLKGLESFQNRSESFLKQLMLHTVLKNLIQIAIAMLLFDEIRLFFQTGLCDSNGRVRRGEMYTTPVMYELKKIMKNFITHVITNSS